MKLVNNNPFTNCIAKIKKRISGTKIETVLGQIEEFFFGDEYDDYEDEMLESKNTIYRLTARDIAETDFVLTLLKAGYTVVISVEKLSPRDAQLFRKRLQMALIQYDIYCDKIGNEALLVAPSNVDVIDMREPDRPRAKVINLNDYRKK